MHNNNVVANEPFGKKLLSILDAVEYRRIESQEDFEDIARLRYKSYQERGVLPLSASSMLDEVDFDDHAYVFGVYLYEELVSTIRVHHVTPSHRVSQSSGIFPDAVNAFLDAGMTLIDPARLAIDPELDDERSALPFLTVRPTIMAAIYFNADRMLQHIRPAHSAFYRRYFYADTVVPPTFASIYGFDLTLLASRTREIRTRLMTRFPIYESQAYERRLMFDRSPLSGTAPLTILPTARMASQHAFPN
ncbi:N-acyl amino acid synthase FeeM domain-containing protein [Pseudorhizobium sp. NPDC055634]